MEGGWIGSAYTKDLRTQKACPAFLKKALPLAQMRHAKVSLSGRKGSQQSGHAVDERIYYAFWNALDRETGSWSLAMLSVPAMEGWGKSRARDEQAPAMVDASAMGWILYARFGFQIVQCGVMRVLRF